MSVSYRAPIVAGWLLSANEIATIDPEVVEDLRDGRLHMIDGWANDSDAVLGIELSDLDCNGCEVVSIKRLMASITDEMCDELEALWKKVYPNKKRQDADIYVIAHCN